MDNIGRVYAKMERFNKAIEMYVELMFIWFKFEYLILSHHKIIKIPKVLSLLWWNIPFDTFKVI